MSQDSKSENKADLRNQLKSKMDDLQKHLKDAGVDRFVGYVEHSGSHFCYEMGEFQDIERLGAANLLLEASRKRIVGRLG